MARGRTLTLLAATMLGTMDSNALVPVIALYALHVGADPIQTGIIVGLFSRPRAGKSVLRAHRGSDWSKATARDRSSVGFGLSFPVCLRDDAAPARARPDQPRRLERFRRTELDGAHG